MKRFGYAWDPLCWGACVLYAMNRWWISGHVESAFFHGYFNDVLLIPAALPLALWLQRRLGWRSHDESPRWSEIALHLTVWSVTAEALVPYLLAHGTADWKDVLAYASGAVISGFCWQGGGSA